MKQAIRDSLDSIQKKADDLSVKLSDPKLTSDINQLTKLNKEGPSLALFYYFNFNSIINSSES